MGSLERIQPKLINGKIEVQGSTFIFQPQAGSHRTFPIETLALFKQLQGLHSIADLAREIYKSDQSLSFRKLLGLIEHLAQENLLHNSKEICDLFQTSFRNNNKVTYSEATGLQLKSREVANASTYSWQQLLEIIKTNPFFTGLNIPQLELLAKISRVRTVKPQMLLITQNTTSTNFFILLKGRVSVRRKLADGTSQYVADLAPGSYFGEFGAFLNVNRTADIISEEDSDLLIVPTHELLELHVKHQNENVNVLEKKPSLYDILRQKVVFNQTLSAVSIFKELPPETLQLFLRAGKFSKHAPNKTLVAEGEAGDLFYIVVYGSLNIIREGKIVTTLEAGKYFGEIALIKRVPRTATVRTTSESILMQIDRGSFYDILCDNLTLAYYFEQQADKIIQKNKNQN